jgi:hypothetical protein
MSSGGCAPHQGDLPRFFRLSIGCSIGDGCDLVVFDLKLCSPSECGKLSFSALDYWLQRAVEKKLVKRK